MANPHRGEVELKAGEKVYKLVFGINSVCELEAALGKGAPEIVDDMGRVTTVRALLWASLQEHHPMSLKEAGAVMQEAGAVATVAAINKAVSLAFPPPDTKGSGKNPQ